MCGPRPQMTQRRREHHAALGAHRMLLSVAGLLALPSPPIAADSVAPT